MDGNSLTQWMSTVFARSEPGRLSPEEYFTARLAHADRQLQALAARLGGAHQRGTLDVSALSTAPGKDLGDRTDAVWGRGSSVTKRLHGLEVEVTVGLQPLATGERGDGAVLRWLVLAPGVTVAAGPRNAKLVFNRFDASWSADEEVATSAERLRQLLGRDAAPPASAPPLPRSVSSARARVIEKASKVVCAPSYVFVVGRPQPRAPEQPRQLGEGSFEVDALFDLLERVRAFAHALATG